MQTWIRPIGLMLALLVAAGSAQAQDGKAGDKKDVKKAEPLSGAEVGKAAPAFELKGIDGKTYKLSDYKDKVVVLEWFNKDCPVCVKSMPIMKETSEKYTKQGVVWIAVDSTAVRTVDENKAAAASHKITYPILMDNDGKVGKSYGAKTTPHMYVINKSTLAYAGAIDDASGSEPAKRNYVADALDAVLAGKPVAVASTKPYGCSVKYKKD